MLDLHDERVLKGRLASQGEAPGVALSVVFSQPSKINAASTTQLAIDELRPNLVIDAGAAGSLDPDLPIGAVVVGVRCFEHDIVAPEQFPRYAAKLTAATLATSSECVSLLADFIQHIESEFGIPVRLGDVASGEKDICDRITRDALRASFGALACDWETSAVLMTASLCGVGALCFRVITDQADEAMHEDYKRNRSSALDNLGIVLREFVCGEWLHGMLAETE